MTKQKSLFGGEMGGAGTLVSNYGIPPFSVLEARSGQWQSRKREWLALGIKSELGRGVAVDDDQRPRGKHLAPGVGGQGSTSAWVGGKGSVRPSKAARQTTPARGNLGEDAGLAYGVQKGRKANAIPGGSLWPTRDPKTGKIVRSDSKGRAITTMDQGVTFGEIPNYDGAERTITGTSIFDPVLCEMVYRWFCPQGGFILDPFAGGSVRGIVASKMGRYYTGIDLSEQQVEANRVQGAEICTAGEEIEPMPEWIVGDSRNIDKITKDYGEADLVFSCPPYGDLEVYSDDPNDLSRLSWEKFMTDYALIIRRAVSRLKMNRFACFVVGDFRDTKTGIYRNFPGYTVAAFQEAGAGLYNEAILVTAIGSLPVRIHKMFQGSRKLGKTHQQVYVFVKGDPVEAAKAIEDSAHG